MKKCRIISLILICFMLLSVFIACGNKKPTENTGETEADENPNIPAKDYGGYEFTFLVSRSKYKQALVSDGETGDVLNDAVYRRNRFIEKKYNVKIKEVEIFYSHILDEARNQSKSGDITFDAIIAGGDTLAKLSLENLLCNLLEIDRFDFDASYWDKNATEQLAIDGKLYFTNCSLNIDSVGSVMFFNKQLVENYGLASPFEYMKNNEWTVDNWAKLVKSVSKDLDNDGKISYFDQIGISYDHRIALTMLYSSEVKGITLDDSGYPKPTLMSDKKKTLDIYNKVKNAVSDENYAFCLTCNPLGWNGESESEIRGDIKNGVDYICKLFGYDRYLLLGVPTDLMVFFSESKSEYGIVPYPKYDKNQEKYISVYPIGYNLLALPREMENVERTAKIIEDMNYRSSLTVVSSWYESIMERGNLKCEESKNNLKIARENLVYDTCFYYDFGGMRTKVLEIDPAKDDIDKLYNMWEKSINSGISKAVDALRKDNGQ